MFSNDASPPILKQEREILITHLLAGQRQQAKWKPTTHHEKKERVINLVTINLSDYMQRTEVEVLLGKMAEFSVVKMLARRI